jgi:hypothetical protein
VIRVLMAMAIFGVLPLGTLAQEPAGGGAAKSAGGSDAAGAPAGQASLRSLRLEASDPENMGVLPVGRSAQRVLRFRNILSVPVRLEVINKSCGCLETLFDRAEVGPGELAVLKIGFTPAVAAGPQAQTVEFRSRWTIDGKPESERGMCAVRFAVDLEYEIRPELATASGCVGERVSAPVWIRSGDDTPIREIHVAHCTLEGWSVERDNADATNPGIVKYIARGPVPREGVTEGSIVLRALDGAGEVTVPLLVNGRLPMRAREGGWICDWRGAAGTDQERVIELEGRPGMGARGVRVEPPGGPVTASLVNAHQVRVRCHFDAGPPTLGSAHVVVLDGDGRVIGRFPVVWVPRAGATAGGGVTAPRR